MINIIQNALVMVAEAVEVLKLLYPAKAGYILF